MRRMIGWMVALATLLSAAAPLAAQNVSVFTTGPRRAWLGFSYESVARSGRDTPAGVIVRDVVSGSPAERAGIAVGDTIVRINDINATDQFIASLGSALSPGDDVEVEVRRQGRSRTFTVTAARPPADYVSLGPSAGLLRFDGDSLRSLVRIFVDSAAASIDSLRMPNVYFRRGGTLVRPDSFPFVYRDSVIFRDGRNFVFGFSDSLRFHFDSVRTRMQFAPRFEFLRDSLFPNISVWTSPPDSMFAWRVDGSPYGITMLGRSAIAGAELTRLDPAMEEYFGVREGVLILRVPRDTPAARAGLESGDVIVTVNGTAVTTVEEVRRELLRTQRDRPARLEVVRKKQRRTIEMRTD